MKNVLVMMSTFNGAKYLKVQLDSIFNQIGVNIHCIIRDDGSTDTTKNILLDYQKSNKNLKI
jgi:rhamnosyltransferase